MFSEKENEEVQVEMAKIDAMDLSDIESPEYDVAKLQFTRLRPKRQLDVETAEVSKRKVRSRPKIFDLLSKALTLSSADGLPTQDNCLSS